MKVTIKEKFPKEPLCYSFKCYSLTISVFEVSQIGGCTVTGGQIGKGLSVQVSVCKGLKSAQR